MPPLLCLRSDAITGDRIPGATVSWAFYTPCGETILPGMLFERVELDGNTLVLSGLRMDVDLTALTNGHSTVEGRCSALMPETGKEYPSESFMILASREGDNAPEEIKEPEPEGTLVEP